VARRPVSPELLERRIAAATAGSGLPAPTGSNYPLVDDPAGPAYVPLPAGSIAAGAISNADVNAAAGIALSKLEAVTAGRVVIGNGSNVATATALSGDVTVTSSGVVTIANDAVTSAKIANDAVGSSEIAANAVGTTEIANDAVTVAKIAQGTAGQILITNATPDTAWVSLSGDVTVNGAGAVTIGNDKVTPAKISQGTAGQILITNATPDTAWVSVGGDLTLNGAGQLTINTGAVVTADLNTATGQIAGAWNSDTANAGFTNVTGGNISRRWLIVGKTMHFRIWFTAGTATAAGSVRVPLPGGVSGQNARRQMVNGANITIIVSAFVDAATNNNVTISANASAGGFTAGAALTNLNVNGTIELA
jgi:hypothetical protein